MRSTARNERPRPAITAFFLGGVAVAIMAAQPAFAGRAERHYSRHDDRAYHHGYARYYYVRPWGERYDRDYERNLQNFGFSGRDPSRVGGEDADLHPSQH